MVVEDLDQLVAEYGQAAQAKSTAEKILKKLRPRLLKAFQDENVNEWNVGPYHLSYYQRTDESLDEDLLLSILEEYGAMDCCDYLPKPNPMRVTLAIDEGRIPAEALLNVYKAKNVDVLTPKMKGGKA